jgi:hypothetical protein
MICLSLVLILSGETTCHLAVLAEEIFLYAGQKAANSHPPWTHKTINKTGWTDETVGQNIGYRHDDNDNGGHGD